MQLGGTHAAAIPASGGVHWPSSKCAILLGCRPLLTRAQARYLGAHTRACERILERAQTQLGRAALPAGCLPARPCPLRGCPWAGVEARTSRAASSSSLGLLLPGKPGPADRWGQDRCRAAPRAAARMARMRIACLHPHSRACYPRTLAHRSTISSPKALRTA